MRVLFKIFFCVLIIMSFDDSSQWASKIINDLIEEKEILEKNSQEQFVLNDSNLKNQKLGKKPPYLKIKSHRMKSCGDINMACKGESCAKHAEERVSHVSTPDLLKSQKVFNTEGIHGEIYNQHLDVVNRRLYVDFLKALELEKNTSAYLKRIDEKVAQLGFNYALKENDKDIPKCSAKSRLLTNLYDKYFLENYIKEEMASRLEENGGSYGSEYHVKDILQELHQENEKDVEKESIKRRLPEGGNDSFRRPRIPKNLKNRSIPGNRREMILQALTPPVQKAKYSLEEDSDSMQQMANVIQMYRRTCNTIEGLVVQPIALFTARMIDFIVFIFFLCACVLYIIYRNMTFKNLEKIRRKYLLRVSTALRNEINKVREKYSTKASEAVFSKELLLAEKITLSVKLNVDDTLNNRTLIEVGQKCDVPKIKRLNAKVTYLNGSNYLVSPYTYPYTPPLGRRAQVKSHQDALVEIVMVEEGHDIVNQSNKGVTDKPLEVKVAEKHHQKGILSKTSSLKSCDSSQKLHNSAKNRRRRSISEPDVISRNSSFNDSSTTSDQGFIFNSTAIGDVDLQMKLKSRSSSNFQMSSPPDIFPSREDFERFPHSNFLPQKGDDFSAMSVNPPSFRSRSEIRLGYNSPSSVTVPENAVHHNLCRKTSRNAKLTKKSKTKTRYKMKHSSSLKKLSDALESIDVITPTSSEGFSYAINQDELSNNKSRKNVISETSNVDTAAELAPSDTASNILYAGDGDSRSCRKKHYKNSFSFDNPEFLPELTTANTSASNEMDSLMIDKEEEMRDRRGSSSKRVGNLRHRVSLILNNWKKTSVVQCVMPSHKPRKKYEKQQNSHG